MITRNYFVTPELIHQLIRTLLRIACLILHKTISDLLTNNKSRLRVDKIFQSV